MRDLRAVSRVGAGVSRATAAEGCARAGDAGEERIGSLTRGEDGRVLLWMTLAVVDEGVRIRLRAVGVDGRAGISAEMSKGEGEGIGIGVVGLGGGIAIGAEEGGLVVGVGVYIGWSEVVGRVGEGMDGGVAEVVDSCEVVPVVVVTRRSLCGVVLRVRAGEEVVGWQN